MADDSNYYVDVIRWLVAHPHSGGDGYLVKGPEHPDAAEAALLAQTSCDVHVSVVCTRAWFSGYRLTHDFYVGDRAMRESGFDPSFRFGPFDGATHHYAPVCLNSLLYRYERDMQHLALLLGKPHDAQRWQRRSKARNTAMHRYLWQAKQGVFADFDFVSHKPSTYAYISSLYPLWAGVATREEAQQVVAKLNLFERPGGLSMSNTNTGLQWDEPFGWAPTNWIGVAGLEASGFRTDAQRIARNWNATVDTGFAHDGTIREKYNVVSGNADVKVTTGYTANEIGFGWTNAVYLKMDQVMGIPAATRRRLNAAKKRAHRTDDAPSFQFRLKRFHSGSFFPSFTWNFPLTIWRRRLRLSAADGDRVIAFRNDRLTRLRHHAQIARLQFELHLLRRPGSRCTRSKPRSARNGAPGSFGKLEIKLRNFVARHFSGIRHRRFHHHRCIACTVRFGTVSPLYENFV